jgi:hypothetical protein
MNGKIDDLRIYDRALNLEDIRAVASSGAFQTETVTLSSGSHTTISFSWNTSGFVKGTYTVSACAWPLPRETDTADNTYSNGNVIVAMIGDIRGPDGKVDIGDLFLIAKYFGKNVPPAHSNWDITGPIAGVPDNKVDTRDLDVIAERFGQIDP